MHRPPVTLNSVLCANIWACWTSGCGNSTTTPPAPPQLRERFNKVLSQASQLSQNNSRKPSDAETG